MPRSGTTLVEQILASHPKVIGAGERWFGAQGLKRLPPELGLDADPLCCFDRVTSAAIKKCADWHLEQLRKVDGGAALRVVDKMPYNAAILGWLAALFPHARFIHCRRDLRDVALSCWMTNFLKIRWANDFDHIAHRIACHLQIMDHWRHVLPTPIFEVDYERLIESQEGESRRLIAWLGLDWDPSCLEFHRTKRSVQTASVLQVRQPIYSRSAGRWRQYEPYLERLFRMVEPNAQPPHPESAEVATTGEGIDATRLVKNDGSLSR